ncbi:hypothetical protein DY000_02034412 [Brassica cretica]|uniref:BAHD acyltransferase n=1 Tax=Brassica cretica TaxID=69181 RepID=A0ABQ7DP15_BRACR|nr:hypothetical protein DY000_02034412 [Brassica cretica]
MAYNVIKISRISPATDLSASTNSPSHLATPSTHSSSPSSSTPSPSSFHTFSLSPATSSGNTEDPKPHIILSPQDAVSLTVAETDTDFSHLSGKGLRYQTELRPLVPELPVSSDSSPILTLQITLFPNQGFCIGTRIHHAAVDGKTLVKFLKSWAHICKYGTILQDLDSPMLLDRTVINLPSELPNLSIDVRTLKLPPVKEIEEDVVRFTFELTHENVKKLMERAKSESTRDRLDPPVPASYFGNCVLPVNFLGYKAKTFLGEEGFVNGVEIVNDAVRDLSSRGAESIWELYEEGLKKIEPGMQKLSVGGSTRFGIYGTDFGWGRPVHTVNVSNSGNLLYSMSESRDETGGVEIGMCLKKCEMDVFVTEFQNGL